MISLVSAVFENNLKAGGVNTQRGTQTSHALISILFYAFGVFAAHRYSALALRIVRILFFMNRIIYLDILVWCIGDHCIGCIGSSPWIDFDPCYCSGICSGIRS